jgi:phthalate 4,5-dioxygenase
MGAIVDRSDEHLTQSDLAIVRWRQKILRVARVYAETGEAPALDPRLHHIRPVGLVLDRDAPWQDEIRRAMTIAEETLA